MKHKLVALALIVLALAAVGYAEARGDTAFKSRIFVIPEDDQSGLAKKHCSDSNETRETCLSFIKGFLKGALLTDAAIIKSISAEEKQPSFSERAIRTRLGSRHKEPTALAGFCLPEDQTIREIAKDILAHTNDSETNSRALAENVYATLKIDYPC